jgi:acyl dehydratase
MEAIARDAIQSIVNTEPRITDWFEVKQEQIDQFADCTLDHQFIHVDPKAAASTPFGSTIAHGFLSLSMLSHFAESFGTLIDGAYMGVNYGFDKVRFISPVKVDSRIRGCAKVVDVKEKKPGQFMFKTEVTVEIENSTQPALKAEWITMQMVK